MDDENEYTELSLSETEDINRSDNELVHGAQNILQNIRASQQHYHYDQHANEESYYADVNAAAKQQTLAAMIKEVKKHPCIWNVLHQDFINKPKKDFIWKRIAALVGSSNEKTLQNDWTRLVTNFKKALKRRVSKSGDGGGKHLPRSEFFTELLWLKDIYCQQTSCNVNNPPLSEIHHNGNSPSPPRLPSIVNLGSLPSDLSNLPSTTNTTSIGVSNTTSKVSCTLLSTGQLTTPGRPGSIQSIPNSLTSQTTASSRASSTEQPAKRPGSDYSHHHQKKKNTSAEVLDILLVKALQKETAVQPLPPPVAPPDNDSDSLFCKSFIGQMKELKPS